MSFVLAISIDVEPDSGPSWIYRSPLAFRGVEDGISKRLTPLFSEYGAKPTYLISNVVLELAELSAFMEIKNEAELGTHLHCEFIAPEIIRSDPAGWPGIGNQCFLDPVVEKEKLVNLTKLFTEKFGFAPSAFRAGRFAAGPNTIKTLAELGYKVDSSITPGIRWWDDTRVVPIDFRFALRQPYSPAQNDIRKKGDSSILEVPVSIAGYWPFSRIWMRPLWCDSITTIAERILSKAKQRDPAHPIVLNCMFHNVDCVEGCSPHCETKEKADCFLSELENLLKWTLENGGAFATLSDIRNAFGVDKKQ